MTEAAIIFLYDNGLRHERVKQGAQTKHRINSKFYGVTY